MRDVGTITDRFIRHVRDRREVVRTGEVQVATQSHVLDSLAAVISGHVLPAGRAASAWAARRSSAGRSSCAGQSELQHAEEAAFVNAVCAHADESDDSHEASRSHPGASIVPTAIAVAEDLSDSGAVASETLLEAVALGYEACALMNWLFWSTASQRRRADGSPHAMGGLWGSAVAAGVLYDFDDDQMRSLVSYTAQMASGLASWLRDEHHIEKAFVFSGMPAWNAVRAAGLVACGWPGVRDTLDGPPGLFSAFNREPETSAFARAADERATILDTNIKKYCVGSPAQAAVQAAEELSSSGVRPDEVTAVRCILPTDLARIVDQRAMTNINVQYLVARTLVDGRCTFAAAHDEEGAARPDVAAVLQRTTLVADPDMEPIRQARVEIELADGRVLDRSVFPVRGTKDDPMTTDEVDAKADDLMSLALAADERAEVIAACRSMDSAALGRIGRALRSARDMSVAGASGDEAADASVT